MPHLVVLGGPNGAGKTTVAWKLLPEFLGCYEFVNADLIARGLSPFRPESASFAAGRAMLHRIRELASADLSFAFESTLSSRSLAPFLRGCKNRGYQISLAYVWVRSAELCLSRVKARVQAGGHTIPEEDIMRRYPRSRSNFLSLYKPLADAWWVFDNSGDFSLIAKKEVGQTVRILDNNYWTEFNKP